MSNIEWESLENTFDASSSGEAPQFATRRAKVSGGWLVSVEQSVTFVPDPEHKWLRDKSEVQE